MKNNKKLFIAILALILYIVTFVIWMFHSDVRGYTATDANGITWYYQRSGNNAIQVCVYSGNPTGTLTIPETLGGYNVVSLGYGGNANILDKTVANTTITKIVIPDTVQNIRKRAFYNFRALESVEIPASTYYIYEDAFRLCSNLKSVTFKENSKLVEIDKYAFGQCSSLTEITIPNNVTKLGANAFYACNSLRNVEFSTKLTTIDTYAFYNCPIEGILELPATVTTIGSKAFANTKISGVNIPAATTSMYKDVFESATLLENINVDESNTVYSSIDGILFNKEQTILISCPMANKKKDYIMPSTVRTINEKAFYYCKDIIGTIVFSENLTTIGAHAFNGCSGLTGNLVIPNTVTTLGDYAFCNCSGLDGQLTISNSIQTIGNSAFSACVKLTGNLIIPDSVTSIGSSAFSYCSKLTGNLTIPNTVTSLGGYAFGNCTGFDGILTIGEGITTIQSQTFQNCSNFTKTIIGSNVTKINFYAFGGFKDIWVNNIQENVTVDEKFADIDYSLSGDCYIHWLGDTHKLTVSTLPGVKLIDTNTQTEILSNDYVCETSFDFKVQVDDTYNYNNLKLIIVQNGDYDNAQVYNVNSTEIYKLERLIRDSEIYVQNIQKELDLSVRTFITQINRENIQATREPIVIVQNGEYAYTHTKFPVYVQSGDLVTYKIRVYNEGLTKGTAEKVSLYIPEGLQYVEDNKTNKDYKWNKETENKISTQYLKSKTINTGIGSLKYENIELVLQVKDVELVNEDVRLVTIAEITSGTDADSTPNSIKESAKNDYKQIESIESTSSSYIKGHEDDDDFENVVLKGKVKVDYTIKINQIDSISNELLNGAKFNLTDAQGNVLKTEQTINDGTLDFGIVTTYGEGEDIYYIEEVISPVGYVIENKIKLKVIVTKTITDAETGAYTISMACELIDLGIDTSKVDYIPIYTIEQFRKIGSAETFTIDGTEYTFATDKNYKLMADLDATGITWEPIPYVVTGIINGNGHKISNLTYVTTETSNIAEIGMFRVFSGTIDNLEIKNVNISVADISADAEKITNYSGVGAIAGVMVKGRIMNTKVSGSVTATTDNVGGFIGHTSDGNIVRLQNCENTATVAANKGSSNIAGLVGCALGALSVQDCINNGEITGTHNNVGGLVGYVKAINYEEDIKANFENDTLEVVVENKSTTGEYVLKLETIDGQTTKLVEGATYTIYNANKTVMQGCESVKLENGKLTIAKIDINNLGLDTYYIKENSTIPGYNRLTGIIKLLVRRYWDSETSSYKVSAEIGNISYDEFIADVPEESGNTIPSQTGTILTKVDFVNVSFNENRAEFINCVNNGHIANVGGNNAGGIVATAHCLIRIDKCSNTGKVGACIENGYARKAGGIISEINAWKLGKFIEISNCTNSGEVISGGFSTEAAGIIAHSLADIKVTNCTNTATITGRASAAAGILTNANGTIIIDGCTNKGEIVVEYNTTGYGNSSWSAAGIMAKNYPEYNYITGQYATYEDINVKISNCNNIANITGHYHVGGIIGTSVAKSVEISDCKIENSNLVATYKGDTAGIIGNGDIENLLIENCIVNNSSFDGGEVSVSSGSSGGIVGSIFTGVSVRYSNPTMKIINCKVLDSTVLTTDRPVGGLIGYTGYTGSSAGTIIVVDNLVEECNIKNKEANYTYGSAGGMVGYVQFYWDNLIIENNTVNESYIEVDNKVSMDTNLGGIIGGIDSYVSNATVKISNNDVYSTDLYSNEYGYGSSSR